MLDIYAGKTALKTIQEKGCNPDLFTSFLGASGGPKWFALYGLDKYIFGEFFNQRAEPLNIIGSSIGAFRAACFTQHDPVSAIDRLAKEYCETVYPNKAKPHEVTDKARSLLDTLFGTTGIDEIINNPTFKAHFIVTKTKGFVSSENKILQGLGLVKSMVNNRVKRSLLKSQYERVIFQNDFSNLSITDPDQVPTHIVKFTTNNMKDALLASGAIPMVMEGIDNIADCPEGMYRDGGIVDYHFDFNINNPGLILYPHFSSTLKAGWFDKNLNRSVRAEHYDNTLLLCPSSAFLEDLPHKKIPDRTDFNTMSPEQRKAYWQYVMKASQQLSQEFKHFIETQNISKIQKIETLLT